MKCFLAKSKGIKQLSECCLELPLHASLFLQDTFYSNEIYKLYLSGIAEEFNCFSSLFSSNSYLI
jgi:hypothetical protein